MSENSGGERKEPKLPPQGNYYQRVAKAKEALEDKIYARAIDSLQSSNTVTHTVKLRVAEQAAQVRKENQLDFFGFGPKFNLNDKPMVIDSVASLQGDAETIEVIKINLVDPDYTTGNTVLLFHEMQPALVDTDQFIEAYNLCNPHNPDLTEFWTSRGTQRALQSVDPTAKRELTDTECEVVSYAIENYVIFSGEIISAASEAIYQGAAEYVYQSRIQPH